MPKTEKYGFFICSCPAAFPFGFARHLWIVTMKQGETHRREVCHFVNKQKPTLGHLHQDAFHPRKGVYKYFRRKNVPQEYTILYEIHGNEISPAEKLVTFMDNYATKQYPRRQKYVLFPGPNSNTFVQWVIDKNPAISIQLPRNAFGKNYR